MTATTATKASLRSQLIGAWDLIEYAALDPSTLSESTKFYPMGDSVKGIIMYTPDGYMSAQLHNSAPHPESTPSGIEFVSYTGQFYLDEAGDDKGRPILFHHMRTSSLRTLIGDTQRRLVEIRDESDGRYLILGVEGTMKVSGEDRVVRVRWKRMPDNSEGKTPPEKVTTRL